MTTIALIFDFDGLILDTETPEVNVWKAIYAERGFEFPVDRWTQIIGGWGLSTFDAAEYLHELANDSLDVDALRARHRQQCAKLILHQPVREGVLDYLDEAQRLGLRLAIASSSPHDWVDAHLVRLGLSGRFERVVCADDVPPGRTKPHPDLYLRVLNELSIRADEALVFEDSPNGVKAAHAAGISVVAVPNPTTSLLTIDDADLKINSMGDIPLADLLTQVA